VGVDIAARLGSIDALNVELAIKAPFDLGKAGIDGASGSGSGDDGRLCPPSPDSLVSSRRHSAYVGRLSGLGLLFHETESGSGASRSQGDVRDHTGVGRPTVRAVHRTRGTSTPPDKAARTMTSCLDAIR